MPRINPQSLLKCLQVLLNNDGGIRGSAEVKRMVALMRKFSNTLVSKVCYTLILKETEDALLSEFMAEGGWALVFQWLGDAINTSNNPFISELLHLLIKCPISLDRLKESNAPRTVKGLSKDSEDLGVRELARQVVEMWLEFIKSGRAAADPVPVPVPPAVMAPPSPPVPDAARSPSPPPTPLAPFKIVVRDGKRVLLPIGGDDATPPKVKRVEKPNDVITESVKDKSDKSKVRSSQNKVVKPHSDADKTVAKSKYKDTHRSEGKDREHEVRRKDSDKKEHSRSSSSSTSSVKPSSSHSKPKEVGRDKHKHKPHSSDKSKDARDKSRDMLKPRRDKDSARKEMDLSLDDMPPRSTPAISSLGKIPKKTSTSTVISAAEASATGGVLGGPPLSQTPAPLPVVKKGTFSDERKRSAEVKPSERPKTVKTHPTKFRSTGLEEEAKPPPSRKKDRDTPKVKEDVKDAGKRPLSSSKEGKEAPPEKKSRPAAAEPKVAHIKEKLEKLEKVEKPGGIKLIPPKPKPVLLESDLFSDALTASTSKEPRKKKRRSSGSSAAAATATSEESTKQPPKGELSPSREAKPLKFYRDTLDDADQDPDAADDAKSKEAGKDEVEAEEPEEAPRFKLYPEGVLLVGGRSRSRSRPRKSVRWRSDADLVTIQEFELDATERVNVSRTNFVDMKAIERNREREALFSHKMGEDTGTELMPWGPLLVVDVPPDKQPPEAGLNSTEKEVQMARQRTVLEAIFFNKAMIPDSPAEADAESHPMTDPKPIPLEDASGGKDATYDYSSTPWPEPKPELKPEPVQPVPAVAAAAAHLPVIPTLSAYPPPPFNSYPPAPAQAAGLDTWRSPEEVQDVTAGGLVYPAGPPGPMVPPMYGMPPTPYGAPPGPMLGPDGFPMAMFPPQNMFGPGPMGPPPPGWGRGPRGPPLPLEPRNICRNWAVGDCRRGSSCRYLHPGENCPPLPTPAHS